MSTLGLNPANASTLTDNQLSVINAPIKGSLAVVGKSGTGKTAAAAWRLRYLVEHGIAAESILVLVPQRRLAAEYSHAVRSPDFAAGGQPDIVTFSGLAQRMITLFWPLISQQAGFVNPPISPRYLNLETAQYYLAKIVNPLLKEGYFESLTIDPNRLFSQILDNLNKSAVVGFPPTEIADRLTRAWAGKDAKANVYQQAQECALKFRSFCLENGFLDFSLQLSVFSDYLWPSLLCRQYLSSVYKHLIYDNIEEDFPIAHDFIAEMLDGFESALIIQDSNAGYRSFLGADAQSASRLSDRCIGQMHFKTSLVQSKNIEHLEIALRDSIIEHRLVHTEAASFSNSFSIDSFRFYPEVLDWVAEKTNELLQNNVNPADIAILTPYLSDSLRFSLTNRLAKAGIPYSTYRPSRSLHDEPAVKTVLTWAKIAHPSWEQKPNVEHVRSALAQSVSDCDYVRADLLARSVYQRNNQDFSLNSFDVLSHQLPERITFHVGESYEQLRNWLLANREGGNQELDHWISRLFGECLSQPGFGYHSDFDAAAAISRLIASCKEFRKAIATDNPIGIKPSVEYVRTLEEGVLSSQSASNLNVSDVADAVFLSPAYSFLMRNRPVSYQFWIDIGSNGWWSRLDQPLTQPYVLNRNWPSGEKWTDANEYESNQFTLSRIVTGLLRQCRSHIFMTSVNMNEHGVEERGQLLLAMQTIMKEISKQGGEPHV